jgi:hypothetical protein
MTAEELGEALICGVVCRGSVDKAIMMHHDWQLDRRGEAIIERAERRKRKPMTA